MNTAFPGQIIKDKFPWIVILTICLCSCRNISSEIADNNIQAGEFTHRMEMSEERLTGSVNEPVFTKDFILADVNLNPGNPRRFQNYSGDLSGRYIEVLCGSGRDTHSDSLDSLVKELLLYQQPDGRFGDPDLEFSEELINEEHMPLLWGNGRLLVGLLAYYNKTGDEKILEAAVKTGDFFAGCYSEVTPKVVKRLEGLGADGIICFTQYTGPLVMLSRATGNKKYEEIASTIYHVLPERGTLHSHGYLTTLLGVLELYEADNDPVHLEYVMKAYNNLINSSDLTVYGSVKEYFGGKGDRDEGCSTADFIRLSLHLYKLTHKPEYLEKAEFAIYNSLYFNQFFTGDFGHHNINNAESKPGIMNAAWWCCTMSGLRAMQIIQNEYFVEHSGDTTKINLLLDTYYSGGRISVDIKRGKTDNGYHIYEINVNNPEKTKGSLMIRKPSWADDIKIVINDKPAPFAVVSDYLELSGGVKNGDKVILMIKYRTSILTDDGKKTDPFEITEPVRGVLCYGPYIMAVDNKTGFSFLAEPNDNIIFAGTLSVDTGKVLNHSFDYLNAWYRHDGYPSRSMVLLRPVSEMTFDSHPYMLVSLKFAAEKQ